ncbi:hypothetical protein O6V14_04755 [Sphingomonas faeni]|uniref:hypothetical protein n=1 Tax=Sphingomonas faeni TaxID=185950 RepID=UPI003346377C
MTRHTPSPTANAQDVTLTLTDAERETLNAALAIVLARTPRTASWQINPHNYNGKPGSFVTYFDTMRVQHSLAGETFADRVQAGLDAQQAVYDDAEGWKARRLAELQAEIAKLGVAA